MHVIRTYSDGFMVGYDMMRRWGLMRRWRFLGVFGDLKRKEYVQYARECVKSFRTSILSTTWKMRPRLERGCGGMG